MAVSARGTICLRCREKNINGYTESAVKPPTRPKQLLFILTAPGSELWATGRGTDIASGKENTALGSNREKRPGDLGKYSLEEPSAGRGMKKKEKENKNGGALHLLFFAPFGAFRID